MEYLLNRKYTYLNIYVCIIYVCNIYVYMHVSVYKIQLTNNGAC